LCPDYRLHTAPLTLRLQRQVRDALDQVAVADTVTGPMPGTPTTVALTEPSLRPSPEPTPMATPEPTTGATAGPTRGVPTATLDADRLVGELTAAMLAHLEGKLAALAWKDTVDAVELTAFEGAGRAAKQVVDEEFAEWAAGAVLTERTRRFRRDFAFRGGKDRPNLFEATSREGREAAGVPVSARDLALWIAANDPACQSIKRRHGFTLVSNADRRLLDTRVIEPFVAHHTAQLERYDLLGFAITNPDTGTVVIAGRIEPDAGPTAGRTKRWRVFTQLVHEYIHTLQHPNIPVATGGSGTVKEGFCEMFTQDVIFRALEAITAGQRPDLVEAVEGRAGVEPDPGVIGGYRTPEDYVDALFHARRIRAAVGRNAVRAAYFHGHVELLGLRMNGDPYDPAPEDSESLVPVPNGITTLDALALACDMDRATIAQDNPTVGDTVVPGQRLTLRGCREHVLVYTRDEDQEDPSFETPELIALQHGITTDAVRRANPALPGTITDPDEVGHLLIPRH
jgi:hypothetical protein